MMYLLVTRLDAILKEVFPPGKYKLYFLQKAEITKIKFQIYYM